MYETTLEELQGAKVVRAFHPMTLGVIYSADVVSVGRKYVSVKFPVVTGERVFRIHPRYVTEVVAPRYLAD